jgi:ribonuclease-3
LLGKGEAQQGGKEKPSLLADALEAVLAAVYLDGGIPAARRLIRRWFAERLGAAAPLAWQDNKTALQELVQARFKDSPVYRLVEETGPSHERRFLMELSVGGRVLARGEGATKKQAAQAAARRALQILQAEEEG